MSNRRMRVTAAFASLALVSVAAAVSTGSRWNLDFAQYKGVPRPDAQDEFRFVIVGDRTGGAEWGLMPQTFREINQLDPDFVISVGDLIDGYGDDDETVHGIWDEFDKTEMPVLKAPFVYVPGNHDIFNATSQRVYEKRYGPRFKSFNYRGLHFITLNTQEAAGTDYRYRGRGADALGPEQIAWLKDDIERNRNARRILIFMHQPAWSALEPIYPLLEGLPVHVFAGHYHKYSYNEIRGIPHVICSATAAFVPEEGMEAYGRFRSYLMASVRDDQLTLALIRLGGVMNPKQFMDRDQSAIRLLTDSCAVLVDSDAPGARAKVVFRNPMDMPVRLQIAKATRGAAKYLFDNDEPAALSGETLEREVDWAPYAGRTQNAEYRAIYRFHNSGGEYQVVDFPIEPKVRRLAEASAMPAAPAIDGDLTEWSGAKWQPIGDRSRVTFGAESWDGPQDLSAQFAVADDDKNIYIALRVTDDSVGFRDPLFEGDSIELCTADSGARQISFWNEPDWRRLIVAPFAAGESERGATSGATRIRKFRERSIWGGEARTEEWPYGEAAFVRDRDHYVIELALPRDAIGWANSSDSLRELDIAINDRDLGGGRETQFTWAGTDRNAFSSRYYGQVRLNR